MSDHEADTERAGVAFVAVGAPVVSIIVLAWHLTDQLVACLRSVRGSADAPPYEVVLVLNGADAAVRAIVADQVSGVTIVDLEANVGYGGGCNAGALRARGRYLVLLNDDAVVDPGWLRTLVAAAERDENVAAVASLLLNPDGTVQEAGSRVLADAGTVQLGAGSTVDEARRAGLLTPREIDYGSGAGLLLRQSAFEAVGGFDPRYEPAYYEDVDLCFRFRAAGWSVRLEPGARVTHVSGGSTSKDRRFRVFAGERSGALFTQRWAATLAAAPPAEELSAVCDPALSVIADPPATVRDADAPAKTALGIVGDYRDWLLRQLDRAEEDVLVQRRLREETARRSAGSPRRPGTCAIASRDWSRPGCWASRGGGWA